MTQHNAALVEQTNAAIEQTEAQASELDRIIEVFRLDEQTVRNSAETQTAPPAASGIKDLRNVVKGAAGASFVRGRSATIGATNGNAARDILTQDSDGTLRSSSERH